jgi:hypothetical protein
VLVLHHHLDFEQLGLFQGLNRFGFLLDADREGVLVRVDYLAVLPQRWVMQLGHPFHLHHLDHRAL